MAGVERSAYRKAVVLTGNAEDALDILQDAMYKLVKKYSDSCPNEWGPLFQVILRNRILDYYRDSRIRNKYFVWFSDTDSDTGINNMENFPDKNSLSPEEELSQNAGMAELDIAVQRLSPKQQQVFMLRVLEGLSVAETAKIMKSSESTVKTHYFRALNGLKVKISDYKL